MKMSKIEGYKSFNQGLITQFGDSLEEGKIFTMDGVIKYHQNGYHFCKRLEDTLRFFDVRSSEVEICKVIGSGDIDEGYDDYYDYYDLYAARELEIVKKLAREEIISLMINPNEVFELRMKRFIEGYNLTESEIIKIIELYPTDLIKRTIDYYQKGDKNAFSRVR